MDPISLYILSLKIGASAMVALWSASLGKHDASLADLWWGLGFLVATLVVWAMSGTGAAPLQLLILGVVAVWALRFTWLVLRRRRAHPGEDPRYASLRAAWGRGFWWKSLFVVFLLQAALQWLVALAPMAAMTAAPAGIGPVAMLGAAVAVAGLVLETVADSQLDAHRRARPETLCATGLRAVVRYPNYLGEMLTWWGIWAMAAAAGAWWTLFSPILLTVLLARVSGAPMLEERLARHAGYEAWRARTPAFVPRPILDAIGRIAPAR